MHHSHQTSGIIQKPYNFSVLFNKNSCIDDVTRFAGKESTSSDKT